MQSIIRQTHPMQSLIERPIRFKDIQRPFARALDSGDESLEIQPDAQIGASIRDSLTDSDPGCMQLDYEARSIGFIRRLNKHLDLDLPFDSYPPDLTFGALVEEINRMIAENNILRLRIDWQVLQTCFREWDDVELAESDLTGTVDNFFDAMEEAGSGSIDDAPKLTDYFMTFIDSLYLDFSEEELEKFDTLSKMQQVYEILNRKLGARKRNDCRVRFGNNWSLRTRLLTRQRFAEFGPYPEGLPMKFIGGSKFGTIVRSGITVEGELDSKIPDMGHYLILTDAGVIEEYKSLEGLLDGGWAID